MRDTRSGGGKRVVVKARHASLNHRQQQIVHTARELVQAPRGSKQHKEAARNLAALNLNQHELALASRAAKQHDEHLQRIRSNHGARLEPVSKGGREVTGILPFALPGMDPEIHYTEKHPHIGHNADEGDVLLRQMGIDKALKKTQISPVLRGVRTATQDIIGPSITAFAQGRHATAKGLAVDAAMLVDPTKALRGGHAAIEAIRAGEGAVDVLRASKAAAKGVTRGRSVDRSVAKWTKTKEGKQAVAELKAHPDRAKVHAQIDAHVDLKPAEKKALKQHFDHEVTVAAHQSGKPVGEILGHAGVQDALMKVAPEESSASHLASSVREVSPEEGRKILARAREESSRPWSITPKTDAELEGARIFATADGKAGFVIAKDGELQNVFNNSGVRGLGEDLVHRAVGEGARHLDAFAPLDELYARAGFRETKRVPFDPQYADPAMPAEDVARAPAVVYMEHPGPGANDSLVSDWFTHIRGAPEVNPAPTEGELAAGKVMEGMKGVPAKQREQKALQSTERGQRAGMAEEAMAGVQGLTEKLIAAKAELEGALPKLQHNGIRGLSESEVDRVGELIENHPDLRLYERLRAMDAIRNAWAGGVIPTPSELRLLKMALGPQVTREAFLPTRLQKYRHVAFELTNMPRSLMASFDVSAPFRQGLVAFATHPLLTGKNLRPMMHYFASEHGYQDLMRSIDARPNRDLYAKAKLAITDVEHSLEKREEQFMSSYAEALNIPVGGGHSVGPGHVVRGSGRAYTGFLVKTRADMFDFLVEKAGQMGHDVTDEKFLRDLGAYVNAATGRGNLGKLEGAAVVLNSTFFSPRLMASRLTFLNPKSYIGLHPFVRQQKLRAAFQTAGAVGAVLWLGSMTLGATVGFDPFNADFGKLKFGDTRVDVSGGFGGYVRMLGTVGMAMTGHDPDRKAQDSLVRFFRGKLSPLPATGVDFALHTDYSGYRTPNYSTEIRNLFIPLIVQDTMKVIQNKDSAAKIALTAGASAVGFGVNTYKASPSSKSGKGKGDTTEKFNSKLEKTMGSVPPEVASAEETKTMYEAAEKRRKDELGVTSMTDEQRTYVKLAVLQAQRPELKQAIDALRQSLDEPNSSEVAKEVDSWAEDELGWKLLSTYQDALR